jgi:hypothetical protein
MTEDEIRALAWKYVAAHKIPVSEITAVRRYPPDFWNEDLDGKIPEGEVWQVALRFILEEDELVRSPETLLLDIEEKTGKITRWPRR